MRYKLIDKQVVVSRSGFRTHIYIYDINGLISHVKAPDVNFCYAYHSGILKHIWHVGFEYAGWNMMYENGRISKCVGTTEQYYDKILLYEGDFVTIEIGSIRSSTNLLTYKHDDSVVVEYETIKILKYYDIDPVVGIII